MRWQNHIFVFFTLVLSLIVTNNLEAQTSLQIEEIVVTATKKETTLQFFRFWLNWFWFKMHR